MRHGLRVKANEGRVLEDIGSVSDILYRTTPRNVMDRTRISSSVQGRSWPPRLRLHGGARVTVAGDRTWLSQPGIVDERAAARVLLEVVTCLGNCLAGRCQSGYPTGIEKGLRRRHQLFLPLTRLRTR
jgi:hypothetical protein